MANNAAKPKPLVTHGGGFGPRAKLRHDDKKVV